MLPVRVKAVSSSSCTLSEASALLQRFLSSDACSDSFARSYVANVAQVMEESMSKKAESEARGKERKHRHFSAPQQVPSSSEPSGEKQSLPVVDHRGRNPEVEPGSAVMEAEKASKKHRKKRKHSALDDGSDRVAPPAPEQVAGSSFDDEKRRDKKRMKMERQDREADDMGARKASESRVSAASLSVEVEEDTVSGKKSWKKDKSVVADTDVYKASEVRVSVAPPSSKVEENMASSKKRRKKEKIDLLASPDKVLLSENNGEDFPSFATEKKKKKKRRRKEMRRFSQAGAE